MEEVKSTTPETKTLLSKDPSNYINWKEALKDALYKEFGDHGEIVEFNRHKTYTPVVPEPDETKLKDQKKLRRAEEEYIEARRLVVRRVEAYQHEFSKVFQSILNSLSIECREDVEQSASWDPVNQKKDPLALFRLIVKACPGSEFNIASDSRDAVMQRYMGLRQLESETVTMYLQRFRRETKYMAEIKFSDIYGTPQDQASRFLNGLKKVFEQHRIDLQSKARLDPNSYPKTVEAAAAGACEFERGHLKMSKHAPNAAIFAIEATRDPPTKDPPVKSKTEDWSEPREHRKRRRRRSHSRSPDRSSSRSSSPSAEERERTPRHPCALCKQKGHLTWKCPWIGHATSAVESAQQQDRDSAKVRRKKPAYATTVAAPPKCEECGYPPGGGPPTCGKCEEFEEQFHGAPNHAARVNVARTTHKKPWNPTSKLSIW